MSEVDRIFPDTFIRYLSSKVRKNPRLIDGKTQPKLVLRSSQNPDIENIKHEMIEKEKSLTVKQILKDKNGFELFMSHLISGKVRII